MKPDLELAEAAVLAYSDPNFYAGNVSARILVRGGKTIIAVAGSNDCTDWIQNFRAKLVKRDGRGMLFDGFADQGDIAHAPFLRKIMSYPEPYVFTAHSDGCVIALQLAAWLAALDRQINIIQIHAAPTVGDADWVAYYQKFKIPTLRIAMLNDPVPSLPGPSHGGFYESDTLVLDTDGNIYQKQDVCSELNIIGLIAQVAKHHGMGNYVRGIRCLLKAG